MAEKRLAVRPYARYSFELYPGSGPPLCLAGVERRQRGSGCIVTLTFDNELYVILKPGF